MNITVVGTGYVGLVAGVGYADLGHTVVCVDRDKEKIALLQNGGVPIHEPGLMEWMKKQTAEGRLSFTADIREAVQSADIVIIAVGTPPKPSGEADMAYIDQAAREVASAITGYTVVAVKSTVPVGTCSRIKALIAGLTGQPFDIVSLPEFLREGSAVNDTLYPDRIVIGTETRRAADIMKRLHELLAAPIVMTDLRSSEMIKYASNAFLATRISFINEIANICEKVGADVEEVARGMGFDKRIGPAFLKAGIGYGGSCFPKDTTALIQIAGNVSYDFKLLHAVVEVNRMQRRNVIDKLQQALGSLQGRTIAVWGLAFKPGTDDVREAPSIEIVDKLLELGAYPRLYDPIAMDNFRNSFSASGNPSLTWCDSGLEAAAGSEAICLLTEWEEFVRIDLAEVERSMSTPVLIDGRNVYHDERIRQTGFSYYPVGRKASGQSFLSEGVQGCRASS